ncbi:hypothetical protein MTP10_32625 [Nonomuraea sp. 3-1Str]|uniref:hypothetical protein n=1 Tax=Nonomuraea sp. 3-1Str TaxID=2929801 RepID=UPI0028669383|nr:hypothetical protein [Nonomuraea sp. 3-1Str]MDR8413468.1 hypothetical protein [Nonomuraea sp. 3-1Str]
MRAARGTGAARPAPHQAATSASVRAKCRPLTSSRSTTPASGEASCSTQNPNSPVSSTTPVRVRTGLTTSPAAYVHTDTSPAPTRQPTGAFRSSAAVRGRRQNGGSPRCSPPSAAQNAVTSTHGNRQPTRTGAGRSGTTVISATPGGPGTTVHESEAAAMASSTIPAPPAAVRPVGTRSSRIGANASSWGCQMPGARLTAAPASVAPASRLLLRPGWSCVTVGPVSRSVLRHGWSCVTAGPGG